MRDYLVIARSALDALAEPQVTAVGVLVFVVVVAVRFWPKDDTGVIHLLGRCVSILLAGLGLNAIPRYLALLVASDFGSTAWISRFAKSELAGMLAGSAIVAGLGTALALRSAFRISRDASVPIPHASAANDVAPASETDSMQA